MAGRFFVSEPKYKFVERRMAAFVVSAVLIVVSLFALGTKGLNFGIDFTGGSLVNVQLPMPDMDEASACAVDPETGLEADASACARALNTAQLAQIDQVREAISALGYDGARVQRAQDSQRPNAVMIRLRGALDLEWRLWQGFIPSLGVREDPQAEAVLIAAADDVKNELAVIFPGVDFRDSSTDVIGSAVAGEFIVNSALAVTAALVLMLIYIAFRFDTQYSAAAIAALVHDVVITFGAFSLMQFEFGLPIVAALLTIVGYSMNDTVVVFDRVREELRRYKSLSLAEVINMSINRTLARTIMTSITTLLALLPLFFFAGESLRGFSFAMIFGVVLGTYSSVFVAAPILMMLGVNRTSGEGEDANAVTTP